MKDYYKILDISADASEDQIRKAYRKLALKYHPDHNPGDSKAEERFKEIAEAYGVLIDPEKRAQYDQWLRAGAQERMAGGGFRYSQQEIFQDLFRDPRFASVFQDLFREFEKAGFRFDQRFFDQVFFGGRGIFFGGVFVWGPFGSARTRMRGPERGPQVEKFDTPQIKPFGLLKRLGEKVGRFLLGRPKSLPNETEQIATKAEDLTYNLTLDSEVAQSGTWVTIAIDRGQGREKLRVRIPPGTRSGTRLRLKGKGLIQDRGTGDLYLTVHLAQ
ncbi:MAG: DnaJ domain-containing protein [Deltaproteobacteria bacterium]|nr:MAG: DnaJ domain-containing protein [Deltaproteobacteria bacterium]